MSLTRLHVEKIEADFAPGDIAEVTSELARLTVTETWDSEYNLNNAIGAILDLSKGDLAELRQLVDAARQDFRDVIYWWMLENKKATHPE